ncbi:MAG: hypothetical protein ACLFV6_16515 [Spirulinaceae cyanobacterium]
MSANLHQLTAFLAALAKTPLNEPIPPLDKDILTDSNTVIINLRKTNHDLKFWDYYDRFHALLTDGYTVKERTKIMRSTGNRDDSENFANTNEQTNTAVAADSIFTSPNPRVEAQNNFAQSFADSSPNDQDYLNWSAGLTGWPPII